MEDFRLADTRMLKKAARLSTRQFDDVMKWGKVANSPLFLVRFVGGEKDTRISAAAPVKIAKIAARRSQIRRIMYDTITPLFPMIVPGTHAIVFAKKDIRELDRGVIRADMQDLFAKNNIYV